MVRRLIAVMLLMVPLQGAKPLTMVPVVYLKDIGPSKMLWVSLPVRPATFFCVAYPRHKRSAPVGLECLSVDATTREVRKDIYDYPLKLDT